MSKAEVFKTIFLNLDVADPLLSGAAPFGCCFLLSQSSLGSGRSGSPSRRSAALPCLDELDHAFHSFHIRFPPMFGAIESLVKLIGDAIAHLPVSGCGGLPFFAAGFIIIAASGPESGHLAALPPSLSIWTLLLSFLSGRCSTSFLILTDKATC